LSDALHYLTAPLG